jgi:hypothetical protein
LAGQRIADRLDIILDVVELARCSAHRLEAVVERRLDRSIA